MLRTLVQSRAPVALTLAAATGLWGLQTFPISRDDVFLGLIAEYAPSTYRLLAYGYATLWLTTPYWVASFAMSMLAILFYSRAPSARSRPLPPFPRADGRSKLALVLGETHFHTAAGRAPNPTWLTIPQTRPLHGHHGARRRRHREDIRLHVSVRRAVASLEGG